jgi:hypothetical protein
MRLAEPDYIPLADVRSGDVLIYRNSTIKVLQSKGGVWPGAWKLTCRDASEPTTARPLTMWLRAEGRVGRFMSNSEIAGRQAASLFETYEIDGAPAP